MFLHTQNGMILHAHPQKMNQRYVEDHQYTKIEPLENFLLYSTICNSLDWKNSLQVSNKHEMLLSILWYKHI